jgi:hypothetical protein
MSMDARLKEVLFAEFCNKVTNIGGLLEFLQEYPGEMEGRAYVLSHLKGIPVIGIAEPGNPQVFKTPCAFMGAVSSKEAEAVVEKLNQMVLCRTRSEIDAAMEAVRT